MTVRQLHIQKRSLPEWSALALFLLPFVYAFLTEFLRIPNVIRFASDFLIIIALAVIAHSAFSSGKLRVSKVTAGVSLFVALFFVYVVIGYVLNFESIFYFLWGTRNNFRFYMALLVLVYFLRESDAKKCLKALDYLFWAHAAITLFQYFVLGYKQDFLGGIFGVQKGCNGYVLAFVTIMISKTLLSYMNGTEGAASCFTKCGVTLLLVALAELKVFFLFFLLILILAAAVTKFSVKKFLLIFVSAVMLMLAYFLLVSLFDYFDGFLSWDYLVDEFLRENYASSEDIGRFTSIPIINERFLTTGWDRLMGLGIGNCDTSAISLFNTAFYDKYVDIHYSVFSVSFVYLEMGIVGLLLFVSFFVLCLVKSAIAMKRKQGNLLFNQMGFIMAVLCFVLLFYNSSLRTEAGYMIYFVLALPFIGLANAKEAK